MKITIGELLKVWNAFDLLTFPRMMGDPMQTPVYNEKEFVNWFKANSGRAICFTSHNSYPVMNQQYNPPGVVKVCVSNLFDDFDDKDKPENAQLDTIKIIEFSQKENIPFLDQFSGSKGFHHFMRLKPSVHEYNEDLKAKTRAIHNWLKDKFELRTMDVKCKEPRRLCRIPYSRYAREDKHHHYSVGQTYCTPMKPEDILDLSIDEIRERAKNPRLFIPKPPQSRLDLDGFIQEFSIDIEEYACDKIVEDGNRVAVAREYSKVPADDLHELIKALIPKMCVHNDLFARNPSHPGRRMAVIQLKELGYSFSQVVALFEEMSVKFNWVDRMFRSRRIYQIKHIYFHVPKYKHDACTKIKYEHGLCVGKSCPKFRGW